LAPVNPHVEPILKGRVTDSSGNGIPGVDVTLYGGMATRWKVASTQTDAEGEYVFDPCRHGSVIYDEENRRWDYFIGMKVTLPDFKSADSLSWWDVRVPQIDRHVVQKDFVLVPTE
jgi:hypothetical protein